MDHFPQITSHLFNCLQISAEYIQKHLPNAEVSIVLGSGLSEFYKRLDSPKILPYTSIPYMPVATVKGHLSALYHGFVEGVPVYLWGGRLHGYEGYSNYQISYIAHLSAFLSCHTLLVTNASGSTIKGSKPGDIILVSDHINHFGKNPLDTYLHTIFRDLHSTLTYDREIIELAKDLAKDSEKFKCYEGTYFWVHGPCFETAYEVESYQKLGGDLFGMSTIPEVMAAQIHGMRMLVTAVVANLAAGLCDEELTHELVYQNIAAVQKDLEDFFVKIIKNLPPFKGQLHNEWTGSICQNILNRSRIEVEEKDVRIAAEWIKRLETGRVQINRLVIANCSIIPKMQKARRVMLGDIPHIAATSHAGRLSELIIGEYQGSRVAVVKTNTIEGLNLYEAYFLLRVFDSLRVSKVHYVFPAFTTESSRGINDYLSFRLHGEACWPRFHPSEITPTGEAFVLAFSGPTVPSNAEFQMCERIGFVPTIANMGVLSAACCLGLENSASFYPGSSVGELNKQDFEWILGSSHDHIERSFLTETRGVLHTPSTPDQLEEFAEECRKYQQSTALVVTWRDIIKMNFQVICSFSFDRLPYNIYFTEEKVMIIEGAPVLLHEDDHLQMMYPYFLINLLMIQKVIIFDAYKPVRPTENWLRITKHCGISAFNPLFGRNIDKWGVRFPDMSACYSYNPEWNHDLQRNGIQVEEGGVIFTSTERPVVSRAILKVAKFLDASGVVQHGVYAAIVAQHRLEHEKYKNIAYFAAPNKPNHQQAEVISRLVKGLTNVTSED